MRTRAFDFLDKPVDITVLRRVISDAVAATAHQRHALRLRRGVEEAGRIQKWMLRSSQQDNGIAIEFCFHPKSQAGGDFVVHHRLAGNRDVILVTDVAGHDLGAAYISSGFTGFARGLLEEGVPLDKVLERYNRFLVRGRFVEDGVLSIAVTALLVDRDQGSMTVYSCGAPPPAWLGDDGWVSTIENSRSSPLGWFDDLAPASVRAPIPPGTVWLWTDGLEELAASLNASPFSVAHALFEARANGSEPEWLPQAADDVLLARIWPGERTGAQGPAAVEPIVAESYSREQIADIDLLQARWERSLGIAFPRLSDRARFDVLLCARESVLNALQHGCGPGQKATFQINHVPSEQILRVRVADPGLGHTFDAERRCLQDTFELGDLQRGLVLVRGFATRTSIQRNGADLTLDFAMN